MATAVEILAERGTEQKETPEGGLIFLPPPLKDIVSKRIEPEYSLITAEVQLVRELDELHRVATGEKALYTDGILNFHVTTSGSVMWGNNRISQRSGIWGFGARVKEGVLTYIEARIPQSQLPKIDLSA